MPDHLFRGTLAELDPASDELSRIEAERQTRKLILIPSESAAPLAVRQALASSFQNIYAEGYPDEETRRLNERQILDYDERLAHYRRYSDPRYYKGVEYADTVEALARRRCAELFAANGHAADELFVNVQALSGAPANNAAYHALIQPGDAILGMDLLHGGHLSHGSPANRSGRLYHAFHYGVDPETQRIDYDAVEALARQHRPKVIIAGYSSYPWMPDWRRFREIADAVGAFLLADIAHIAGMVAAGVVPSPVGIADVVTFTTHKSLCGPRGAVLLTTSRKLARQIDRAVFPGEQGGPHVNTMLAQAVAFRLARTPAFRDLQQAIVRNCVALTHRLEQRGLRIPFGGTETHMTNVDCRTVLAPDGTPLSGDQAARILDLAGIVVNRNTIPGDRTAASPSGIRLGTPWITQRGFDEAATVELADAIADVLLGCRPYRAPVRKGSPLRAKIDFSLLNQVRARVRELAGRAGSDGDPVQHGYPHFYSLDDPAPREPYGEIGLSGSESEGLLRWATSARPEELGEGEQVEAQLVTPKEAVPSLLARVGPTEWRLTVPSAQIPLVLTWLRDLSDGFVALEPGDPVKRSPGPAVVRWQGGVATRPTANRPSVVEKPWYVGVAAPQAAALPAFAWTETATALRRTALFETHRRLGAKMVPFAGWEMPVWYTSVIEEHVATRTSAGLFDVSHMGVYQAEGPQAAAFLDSLFTNDVDSLAVGESHYTQLLAPDGSVIDDAMIYRRAERTYLIVVNASNDDKNWAWLEAARQGSVRVDERRPGSRVFGVGVHLRNLRLAAAGQDQRVDLALQGPRSLEILLALRPDEAGARRLKGLPWAGVTETTLAGIDLVVSRTGYTGERVAFELFVHPDKSVELWNALLKAGEPVGIKPVGLGARDSLRTEAGLPLYGNEMAGPHQLGVGDAGFGTYVKTYKPWFVGREAFLEQEARRQGEVARFRFDEKGVRMAHGRDPVVDRKGRVIGFVTSCAVDREGFLLGQAYLDRKSAAEGTPIGVFQGGYKPGAGDAGIGQRLTVPTAATVLSRFPA
ncbi:MAG TPA: glycine cleavage system aminomethyltransferase GcvT [Anaerolineales bacterium]|nr:glycine cleavage system aminomethyltransferase GcvT [Anaerolineales bacterium]